MRNPFLEAMELRLEQSRAPLVYGLVLATAAFFAVALADLTWGQRALAVFAAVGTVLFECHNRWRAASRHRVLRAVLRADDSWQLLLGKGVLVDAELVRSWGDALGPVIALEWRCPDGIRCQAWLWQRDTGESLWRRLRVRLRLS